MKVPSPLSVTVPLAGLLKETVTSSLSTSSTVKSIAVAVSSSVLREVVVEMVGATLISNIFTGPDMFVTGVPLSSRTGRP